MIDRFIRVGRGAGSVAVGAPSYKGFRFPVEIISHCVWLYHRFPLRAAVRRRMRHQGLLPPRCQPGRTARQPPE
ncbi:MAG: hypothetical protein DLM61_14540 [Pseudonocardiales bacterium]|nr:MAG: hypothetical protein DLM61_14540 [Pseudonocardiales bacterium]